MRKALTWCCTDRYHRDRAEVNRWILAVLASTTRVPHVTVGQPKGSVVAILGSPNYLAGSRGAIHAASPNCVPECVYAPPLAPLLDPDDYVVSRSSDR